MSPGPLSEDIRGPLLGEGQGNFHSQEEVTEGKSWGVPLKAPCVAPGGCSLEVLLFTDLHCGVEGMGLGGTPVLSHIPTTPPTPNPHLKVDASITNSARSTI